MDVCRGGAGWSGGIAAASARLLSPPEVGQEWVILSLGSAVAKGMVVYCSGMAAGDQAVFESASRRASCRGGPGLWPFAPCRVRLLSGRRRCLRRTIRHIADTEVDVLIRRGRQRQGSGRQPVARVATGSIAAITSERASRAFQGVTGLLVFRQAQRIVAVTRTPRPIPGMTSK